MVNTSRLSNARSRIIEAIDAIGKPVFMQKEIQELLSSKRADWLLAVSTGISEFLEFLKSDAHLTTERFEFPKKSIARYVWRDATLFQIVQSLDGRGYFSHFSAMQYHNLTLQVPKVIYFNREQKLSGGEGVLSQIGIDRAFRGAGRVTNNLAEWRDYKVALVNGRNTSRLGVVQGDKFQVTDLERTLIDIVVRPMYAGGVGEVQLAFDAAAGAASVNRLMAYYRKLKYVYPYHQAIGYYLERAGGYSGAMIDAVRRLPMEFDFYLTYGLKKTRYVREWRLYVPE